MSESPAQLRYTGACPHCGAAVAGPIWLVADAAARPTLAEAARQGRLNTLTCAACGQAFMAPAPLLYHDRRRELAVVYIPPGTPDPQDLADALVARCLELDPAAEVGDYLLSPLRVDQPGALRRAVAGAGGGQPRTGDAANVAQAAAWCAQQDSPGVAAALELLAGAEDQDGLMRLFNAHPELLQAGLERAARALGERAEQAGLAVAAEVLLDVAALLHVHTPPDLAEADDEADLPEEAVDLLIAGDLTVAEEILERPDPRRVTQTVEREDADRREGFMDHAALFADLLSDMMEPATPDAFAVEADLAPALRPVGASPEAFAALIAAAGPDQADEVLDAHPELISAATTAALQAAMTAAWAAGEEGAAAQYEMLLTVVTTAGGDEQPEEPA
jgi:hypothetical protein